MNGRIFKSSGSGVRVGFLAALILLFLAAPGCKKKEDNLSGTWKGVLTIETAHQHEEHQQWDEVIIDEEGRRFTIVHDEYIAWNYTGQVVINFAFDINAPVYEARVNGEGEATQSATYNPTTQCAVTGISTPGFKIDVFGSVDSSTFTLQFAPQTIPSVVVNQLCQHVRMRTPAYGLALVDILSEIRPVLPYQSGVTSGGSGSVTPGSGFSPMAYIYKITLTRE